MTKADIIRRLYELDDRDVILHSAILYQYDKELCFAACEQYGSVQIAVEAAGLRYSQAAEEKIKFALEEMERRAQMLVAK